MAGFLDNFGWPKCESIDWGERRNTVASVVAGLLFFTGWWIMIDAAVYYPSQDKLNHAFHTCGVFSTLAFFMSKALALHWLHGDVRCPHRLHVDPVRGLRRSQEGRVPWAGRVFSEHLDIFQHTDVQVREDGRLVGLEHPMVQGP